MSVNFMQNAAAVTRATRAARERTGNNSIATCVKRGKFQVVRVEFNNRGVSTIVELTEFLPAWEAVNALKAL